MKIWFDLCHPPHVLFFAPQIQELNRLGHETVVTVRDRFQVSELCDMAGIKYFKIGRDYGKQKILKARGVIIRTIQMYWFARRQRFNIAVSHGSTYQVLAASLLRIPSIFMTDYEHIYLRISRKLATKIIMPEIITNDIIKKKGINLHNVIRYPGFKEDVYLENFIPDSTIIDQLKINSGNIIVTLRPPAVEAHYHNPQSEKLFSAVMLYLSEKSNVTMIVLPRTKKEKRKIQDFAHDVNGGIIIPSRAVNGLNLIWHSDLVISGGGTMNREAAALGVPVYTIFRGTIGAVDRFLGKKERLHFIEKVSDIEKIKIKKKIRGKNQFDRRVNLKSFLVERIISIAS